MQDNYDVESSTLGISTTVSATIGIPEIAEMTAGLTTSMDVTNTEEVE
jgi:hypothetical protein